MVRLKVLTRYGEFVSCPRPGGQGSCDYLFNDVGDLHGLTFRRDDDSKVYIPRSVILESIVIVIPEDGDQ